MNMTRRWCGLLAWAAFAGGLGLGVPPPPAAAAPGTGTPAAPAVAHPAVDALRKQFEDTLRAALQQERDAGKLRRQRYLADLTALEESLQSAGNQLSAVLAVRAERARFEESGDVPATARAANPPALRQLQDAWRAQAAAAPRRQAQTIVTASERYLQGLAQLQQTLGAQHDQRGVDEVKAEKDRLLDNNRVREALALLQAPAPAGAVRPPAPGGAEPENRPAADGAAAAAFKLALQNNQELVYQKVLKVVPGDSLLLLTGAGQVRVPFYRLSPATQQAIQQMKRQGLKVRGEVDRLLGVGLLLRHAQYETEQRVAPSYYNPVKRMDGNTERAWAYISHYHPVLVLLDSRDPAKTLSSGMAWQGLLYPAGSYAENNPEPYGYPRTLNYKCFALTPEEAVLWVQNHPE